jgi:hypothetical protein
MSTVATERSLDEILGLSEPYKTNALTAWIESDEPVKIKASKTPFKVRVQGKDYNFGPAGRVVGRRTAISLLSDYGKDGKYVGMDRETGLTRTSANAILSREDESTKFWQRRGLPDFSNVGTYLYHEVEDEEAEDTEA